MMGLGMLLAWIIPIGLIVALVVYLGMRNRQVNWTPGSSSTQKREYFVRKQIL